jgi:uncharacterized sulfatase
MNLTAMTISRPPRRRQPSVRHAAHAAVGLILAAGAAAAGVGLAAPPNVLLIISDDQGWNDYGFAGHPHIRTPCLDALARESRTFTRGYVPSSLCRPSLATILTGLYPGQHGIVGNDPARLPPSAGDPQAGDPQAGAPQAGDPESVHDARRAQLIARIDACETIPDRLGTLGYRSLQTGKWWEGGYRRGGFTDGMTRGFPDPNGRHGDAGLAIGRQGLQPIVDFIDDCQAHRQPFFVWYAPLLPHAPHDPPAELLAKYLPVAPSPHLARYWAMCEWFDATCGELLAVLDRRGLREQTLVVYVTDNGWINRTDSAEAAPRSKRSPYEGGVRTPLMVRWPGRATPGIDRSSPASSIDIAPTVFAACGLERPPGLPGVNLLDDAEVARRHAVFGEIYAHDVEDLQRPDKSLLFRWIVRDNEKLIVPRDPATGPAELYDLGVDPTEQHDRAATAPQRVATLTAEIDAWRPLGPLADDAPR